MSSSDGPDLRISEDPKQAAQACSEFIRSELKQAIESRGHATFAMSGGSSPKLLFEDMAKDLFDWSDVHFFWVDERCVPPDNKDSNYKLAYDALLGPAKIEETNIHRVFGELPPAQGAAKYVRDIKAYFDLGEGKLPAFDVLHRGMGPDAHTASLFPGNPLVHDATGIATNVYVEKFNMDRVTLLPAVLNLARRTVLQVTGEEKAEALHNVLRGPIDFLKYPCQIATRDAQAVWFLDKAATSKL